MTALENARLCVREKDSNAIVRVNKYRSEREASASKVPVWDLGSQVGIARQLMMGICGP
ncbi:hypothetical protein FOIG_05755 [Fusarium odoratissimum NRRL 54006]|uniref:Uncharacterized protein n=1 Tax=Fusarium odoratissimum (strain NRRL 54006) TaxID=1089451 RepID=X0L629_FUSO5|nr:uncharacterized protein FOIG_05755 [Fusarium odoratissimum NRRL 54006]EXM04315.1 hypothetical protein FOIG_05755 [Fusarium odoratissimum NRRL 54006]